MNISLNPTMEKKIHEMVASGLYNSVSEVVRDALRLLFEHDTQRQKRIEEFNKEIELGYQDLEAGRVKDGETAMNELIKRCE